MNESEQSSQVSLRSSKSAYAAADMKTEGPESHARPRSVGLVGVEELLVHAVFLGRVELVIDAGDLAVHLP